MAANRVSNSRYENCSFCIINYFETSSTAIQLQNTKFLIPLWVFVDGDNGDNEMIMQMIKWIVWPFRDDFINCSCRKWQK